MAQAFNLQENVPLAPLTTLGVGGPARYFVTAQTEAEVLAALAWAGDNSLPVFILGGGSNLLVADAGYTGLVLNIALPGVTYRDEGGITLATAAAGEDWDGFVGACVARNLAGVECLSGIPGLVGGTPVQNVGAYGQEVSETIRQVRVFDRQIRQIVTLSNAECGFAYRTSLFNTTARGRYVVLAVEFALLRDGAAAVRYADLQKYFAGRTDMSSLAGVRIAVRQIRAAKSMVIVPDDPNARSAGSFFKNPIVNTATAEFIEVAARRHGVLAANEAVPHFAAGAEQVKIPAAWLIERAGFHKGYKRGRAGISTKHTLALINCGGAQARDILALMREIQEKVHAVFGVALTPEPVFLGFEG